MRTIIQWSALLGSAVLAFACSSSSSGFNGQPGGADNDSGESSSSSGATGSSSGSGGTSSSTFSTSGAGNLGTGTCKTGEYAGTFNCEFYLGDGGLADASADSGGLVSVGGMLSFALTQNMSAGVGEGTGTDTATGTFAAATGGIIAATADVTGTLQCSQGIFTGALTNGDYGFNFNGMPVSGPGNTFMGPFDSKYNGSAFVDGTWSLAVAGEGTCLGSWTASYTGPLPTDAGGQ